MHHAVRFTLERSRRRLQLIEPLVYRRRHALAPFRWLELPEPEPGAEIARDFDDAAWPEIAPHSVWGRRRTHFVLRTRFNLPPDWDPQAPTALFLPLGEAGDFSHPEALVYLDGEPHAACDRHHQEVLLPAQVLDGQQHSLALHGWTGLGGSILNKSPGSQLVMRPAEIVQIDPALRALAGLLRITIETTAQLAETDPVTGGLLNALEAALKTLDTREPFGDSFYASAAEALHVLRALVGAAGAPLDVRIHAAGHAHIDVAWLWTLRQTRQKAARTFLTALRLMEQYPGYRFSQSQPQLYEFIRQDFPDIFAAIRDRAAEGRWEPLGGMWVEADCNLTGAEALARQFVLGRSFFRKHFGPDRDAPVLWLPDVFGYAWALPQLIRQAGLDYFMTIKIGWSQYNRMPYDTFWWQGIDGTRILTHFSTTPEPGSRYGSTYNAKANPEAALGAWRNFKQRELHSDLLMAYGYGDGGGGPSREMLENISEMGAFPGLPQTHFSGVLDFFRDLEAADDGRYPTWNGELYLEYHRGTYTTQARSKRANRKAEFALHDAEFLAAAAHLLAHQAYPAEAFTALWRTVCLNQFHDILPGSSIAEVYEESLKQYADVMHQAARLREKSLAALSAVFGGERLLVNPTPFRQAPLVQWQGALPVGSVPQLDGEPLQVQQTEGGWLVQAGVLPPYSLTPIRFTEQAPPMVTRPARAYALRDVFLLENGQLLAEFSAEGDLIRLYDKSTDREVLPPGAIANQFQAFEDRPLNWDAWDIDLFYEDRMWIAEPADSIQVVEDGPLRAAIEVRRRILNSDYTQRISLEQHGQVLRFDTQINWREKHVLLKAAFPVDLLAPTATHEIQWGSVERPTHRNTSWDWARFETCAHKWIDLSEGDYGVSLLNDCKYGHDVHANTLRLTLLRAPTSPDPDADQGEHVFTYSLMPHADRWNEHTLAAAYALNDPPFLHAPFTPPQALESPGVGTAFLTTDPVNLVIETVKMAENGDGLIVRLFESRRRRGPARVICALPLLAAWETNLLEENQASLETHGHEVRFTVRPFQILTLRLQVQPTDLRDDGTAQSL